MGGAASRPSNGEAYSRQAAEAKKLPDQILTLFFNNANLLRLLELHNIGQCSRFIFTTSSELATLFQKLQVYPKLGAKGEILFASVSDLAPGLLSDANKNAENKARLQEKTHARNELCVDIAYFYVRIFQIYSALALTVIDADPLRKKRFVVAKNPMYSSKPQNSPLGGGYRPAIGSGPLLVQLGGALISASSRIYKNLFQSLVATPFIVFVDLQLLKPIASGETKPEQTLELVDKKGSGKPSIYLIWDWPGKATNLYEVKGTLQRGSVEKTISLKAARVDETHVTFTYTDPDAGSTEQKFKRLTSGRWVFEYNIGEGSEETSDTFFENIYQLYGTENKKLGSNVTSASTVSSGISTSFDGFEKLKKIFKDAKNGAEFPKAYCMARLMTLINPVFTSELAPNQYYLSQICKKKFDFENTEFMPRAGTEVKSNTYIRSFTSLYYDDYKYNRVTGKLELTQTEPSRSSLRAASVEFASMYSISGDPNFLVDSGGAPRFTSLKVCEGKDDRILRIKNDKVGKEFLEVLQRECVDKMLNLQKQHTVKVNKLLMKMFKIETNPVALKLQPAIKAGGKDAINAIGVEAHDLLLDYYRKSEALYVRGITLFANNVNAYEIAY